MKEHLQGMFWEQQGLDFKIPFIEIKKSAIFVFKKNLASITWNCMTTLENNPTSLPQTETILKGQAVGGISIDQLMQVKNYGDGAKKLIELIASEKFRLSEQIASTIHEFVGREDALTWGTFRNSDISIRGIGYNPPHYSLLTRIAEKGFSFLENDIETKEGAIATFLFMSRSQFFHDANKRTSSLMMNGHLMNNGYFPITVLNRDSEEFNNKLAEFYNTGNATDMMKFFEKMISHLYCSDIL